MPDDQPALVLASTSPFRRELLRKLGLRFDTAAPHIDETPLPHEDPESLVKRLSLEKARDGMVKGRWGVEFLFRKSILRERPERGHTAYAYQDGAVIPGEEDTTENTRMDAMLNSLAV